MTKSAFKFILKNFPASWSLLWVFIFSCQSPAPQEEPVIADQSTSTVYKPEQDLGNLFHDIQMAEIFADSKTFVDSEPLYTPDQIHTLYQSLKNEDSFDLGSFVNEQFRVPATLQVVSNEDQTSMIEHLHGLWPKLTRTPDQASNHSSLLPLPYPYVVPGGRFREVYYWDSYFTMLGLLASDQDSLMLNMLKNFAYLINEYGFIPNGNRSYYLGRSQPPFFSSMVMLWADSHGLEAALPFLPQMVKEYEFWMDGMDLLTSDEPSHARVVQLVDGTILNRYWDNFATPRPESYREDYQLAENFSVDKREQVYRDLRAGAESGWDYSSRWFTDGHSLDSIQTTAIAPVDLNCLLYFSEKAIATLSEHAGNTDAAARYQQLAAQRLIAINSYFWDEEVGYYSDYNLTQGVTTKEYSAAGMMPLYFQVASPDQARRSATFLKSNLLFPGGVVSTTKDTGQQWDYPNGWAPQQWVAIQGLHSYDNHALADDITQRWLTITERVYQNTGKMMEKYNVVDLSLAAGGGEYPTQDGFGWTNGVTLALTPPAQ